MDSTHPPNGSEELLKFRCGSPTGGIDVSFFGIYLNFSDWQRINLRPIYLHNVSVSCPLKQVFAADRPISAFRVQAASFLCLYFTGMLPAAFRANSILAPNLHFVCLLWMDSTHYIFTSSVLSLPLTVSHNKKNDGHVM